MADAPAPQRKPRDEELDVWGLTHAGLVRPVNEDHFLLGSLHKHLEVKATSLPTSFRAPMSGSPFSRWWPMVSAGARREKKPVA